MVLKKILQAKKQELEQAKRDIPLQEIHRRIVSCPLCPRDFAAAIAHPRTVNIIAEVKKASPSKGILCQQFDPVQIAQDYAEAGAKAISIITERNFFQGDPAFIQLIRSHVDLPLLRKDFLIDEYQLYESVLLGADAILLIVAIMTSVLQLQDWLGIAEKLGIACLVEVHTPEEVEKALQAKAKIIGINNRNLQTLEVDRETTSRLIPLIGQGPIIVAESGISDAAIIQKFQQQGVDAFLVGEYLMTSADRKKALRNLRSKR